jgi:hypothetical protein
MEQDVQPLEIASLVASQREENLGRSVELGPEDREPRTVLQLELRTSCAGELVTVHLRSERASFDGPRELGVPNGIARIEYGHGGDRSGLLELDWDQGTQITLPAGSLRVMASYPSDAIALDRIRCGAFVVRGARAAGTPGPRRTLVSESVTPATLTIPLGAKSLTVWDLLTPTAVQWLDHAGALLGSYLVLAFGTPPPGPVPVPPSARFVSILGPHLARLVFDIEG